MWNCNRSNEKTMNSTSAAWAADDGGDAATCATNAEVFHHFLGSLRCRLLFLRWTHSVFFSPSTSIDGRVVILGIRPLSRLTQSDVDFWFSVRLVLSLFSQYHSVSVDRWWRWLFKVFYWLLASADVCGLSLAVSLFSALLCSSSLWEFKYTLFIS